jgi:hypothetical protein
MTFVVFLSFQVNFGIITKLRTAMTKAAFKKRILFTRKLNSILREKPANCHFRNVVLWF